MKLEASVYKVIIVDDERIYLKGLSNFITWEKTPFSLTGLAYSGKQAMDMIFKSAPNIMISDIHMTPIDGIELAHWVNQNYPLVQIILMGNSADQKNYASKMPHSDFIDKSLLTPKRLLSALTRAAHKADEMGKSHKTMRQLLEYIDSHYQEHLTLKELSIQFNFNYSYLSSYFVQHNRKNFSDYLNLLRIRKSISLLEQTTLPIQQVGEAVGFMEINSFTRVFKKIMEVTPSQYRADHRKRI